MRKLLRRIVFLFRLNHLENELAEEMECHRAMLMEQMIESGSDPKAAATASRRAMGNTTLSREVARSIWIWPWLEQLLKDSRYAFRSLIHKPLLTLFIAAILSATIGLVCSAFAVLDAVVLRKLPVPNPEELVFLIGSEGQPFNATVLDVLGENRENISNMFGFIPMSLNATVRSFTIPISANVVRGDYFGTLRTVPQLGRFLEPKERRNVAVISNRFWRKEFAASPDVIGRSLKLGTIEVTIIGVTQPDFFGIEPSGEPDVTLPDEAYNHARGSSDFDFTIPLYGVARLKPGESVGSYKAQLDTLWPAILQSTTTPGMTPDAWQSANGAGVQAFSVSRGFNFATVMYPHIPRSIQITFWLSVLIFSTGCLTLALLTVAQCVRNQHQSAVRLAIGGSRWRLLRPSLIENIVLSVIGCIGGLMIAFWCSRIAAYLMPDSNILNWHIYVNTKVVLIGVSTAMLIVIMSGLISSWFISRISLTRILHQGTTVSMACLRLRMGLLTVQLAMSVLLVHYALFYVGELSQLSQVPAGFDIENLHIYRLSPKPPEKELNESYFPDLLSRINRIPGVESAALTLSMPPFYYLKNQAGSVTTDDLRNSKAAFQNVLPGFFQTLRLPLLSGRNFSLHDRNTAVITSNLAERLYPGENPLNHTVQDNSSNKPYTIVGVVGNIAYFGQRNGSSAIAFTCCAAPASSETGFFMAVRTKRPLADLGRDIRACVEHLGAHYVSTMAYQKDHLNWSRQQELMLAAVSGMFGGLILFLTVIGLYAFCSYIFTFRNKELAIRTSFGATAPKIAAILLRKIAKVLVFGLAIGIGAIFITQKMLSSFILDVEQPDLQNMMIVSGIILCITCCAVLIPTLKAIRMNVFEVLRIE